MIAVVWHGLSDMDMLLVSLCGQFIVVKKKLCGIKRQVLSVKAFVDGATKNRAGRMLPIKNEA
jgi:hypothetical protein